MEVYPYDLESYPNIFTMSVGELSTGAYWLFEVSDRRNDSAEMYNFLCNLMERGRSVAMAGFNNIGYDYELIHYFMTVLQGEATALDMYMKTCEIINSNDDYFPVWQSERLIPQWDLFKIHHFDNHARSTSLKMLEFQMMSDNIQDLPFEVGTNLTYEQMDVLCQYNHKDREETTAFLLHSVDAIKFRMKLSEQYNRDFMNHNDTKIGKDYFIMRLHEAGFKTKNGKQLIQTFRPVINLNDAVFDYIHFERPEFQSVINWFKAQQITETKGVFTDIPEHKLGDVAQYAVMKKKRVRLTEGEPVFPPYWEERAKTTPTRYKCYNMAEALNVTLDGFKFVFGLGGIHGSINNAIVRADEWFEIIDIDVKSYYPKIIIENGLYPEHFGPEFGNIMRELYNQRIETLDDLINAMLKLALNGVYGDSNNIYSPFYDPFLTMSTTINGQLLLCLLAEKLMKIPNLTMIQINTDGMTVKIPKQYVTRLRMECNHWEKLTRLTLEYADYDRMFIRDVNNYLAVQTDGKVKRKGAYVHHSPMDTSVKQKERLGWHQNTSSLVVAKAAEEYLVHGVPIRDFIINHGVLHDFMLRAKVPRSMKLVLTHNGEDERIQNISRFYVSTTGKSMFKLMPPLNGKTDWRRNGICAGWLITECNCIDDAMVPINYEYYIKEAEKLVQLKSI